MGYSLGETLDFQSIFERELDYKPELGTIIEYNSARVYGYNRIIFVEGYSDTKFYSRTNMSDLRNNSFYIYATQEDAYVGKEAVFEAYHEIISNKNLFNDFRRCIFIVDQDWDDFLTSKNSAIGRLNSKDFFITYGHSMESYFLSYKNLSIIFSAFALGNNALIEFWSEYTGFVENTAEFWALKATVTFAISEGIHVNYRKQYDFDRIFRFKYDEGIVYRTDYYEFELEKMKNAISSSEKLQMYFKRKKEVILSNPEMVRGHDAFHFLQCYLKKRHGVKLDLYKTDQYKLDKMIGDFEIIFCS